MEAPQTPTDGTATATNAPEVKATAAPAATATAPEQKQPETTEKPLPGLSTEKPKDKSATARAGAPEKYEWKIEGDPKFVSAVTKKLEPLARSLGMSSDEIHGVYDTFAGLMKDQTKSMAQEWAAALEADKEIGGDKLEESLALADAFVSSYGDDEMRGLLAGPMRSNPAFIRMLVKAQRDVSGDRMPRVPDQKVGSGSGDAWYPTMKK